MLGKPPVMVAGMTPTTVSADINVACAEAGYHVELAGGGHFTDKMLIDKIIEIENRITPGTGITINSLFLNPRLWGIQYPLACKLRREGHPIEGFTIAAGVPSIENANEIIANLFDSGIKHVSFKPGSLQSIYQVVTIAKQNQNVPIILQWTGGRGGGHHSFEDFHQPILESYATIRSQRNVILIAGSGFGNGEESFPYLTGEWSLKYGFSAMPFDGILLASRMLVSKESKLSPQAKELLVKAKGVENELEWEKSYKGSVGGIITVKSELGEPIHKVATKSVLFWKELDETIFSLPKEKRIPALESRKFEIIKKLNSEHQKVWFGKKKTGEVAIDLKDMTYEEVLLRLVELCYVDAEKRWIDHTYRSLIFNFIFRLQQRFSREEILVKSPDDLIQDGILSYISNLINHFGSCKEELLTSEDVLYFLQICSVPTIKPVPFIPVLDESFEFWFKKDSLWAAEDINAIPDKDPQRVCILQGPVAVRYSSKIDETCQEILDNINQYYIDSLVKKGEKTREVPWLSPSYKQHGSSLVDAICDGNMDWLSELVSASNVLNEKGKIIPNLIKSALENLHDPPNSKFSVSPDRSAFILYSNGKELLSAKKVSKGQIKVICNYYSNSKCIPLEFEYEFSPIGTFCKLFLKNYHQQLNSFYWQVWFGSETDELHNLREVLPNEAEIICDTKIYQRDIDRFCRTVKNHSPAYQGTGLSPMDFIIVVAWPAVTKLLFVKGICEENLLNLVHLSNEFVRLSQDNFVYAGDDIRSVGKIAGYYDTSMGRVIAVEATAYKGSEAIVRVESRFLVRSSDAPSSYLFRKKRAEYQIILTDEIAIAIQCKPWITITNANINIMKARAELEIAEFPAQDKLEVKGKIIGILSNREEEELGHILFEGRLSAPNYVIDFFERHQVKIKNETVFDEPIVIADNDHWMRAKLEVLTNQSNEVYSQVSGDFNPIHTSRLFAILAGLGDTITHGMWTSAATKAIAEAFTADNKHERLVTWKVEFTGIVLPGDAIKISFSQNSIRESSRILTGVAVKASDNSVVLRASFEVKPPSTAFVFTGQGSQVVGMGMDLYETSPVARAVWDQAEKHFIDYYGFSILNIVRTNPQQLTVYFGGRRGEAIKRNYQRISVEVVSPSNNGTTSSQPLFPEIDDETEEYTFRSPQGLLFATQFTQPALVLFEKAAYEDLKSKGLIGKHMPFAGHSLGEYAALAAIGNVIDGESLCDIVFYRGLTMQKAVKRDSEGRSSFAMIAVNPSRVHSTFDEESLRIVVESIREGMKGLLLEIVNYNIEGQQYVLSGDLSALECLTQFLNFIYSKKINISDLRRQLSVEQIKAKMGEIVEGIVQEKCQSVKELKKGIASIPLAGIDVPFHSSFLLPGVSAFRNILLKKFRIQDIIFTALEGRYIPNLVGFPFKISLDYLKLVFNVCRSPRIEKLISDWNESELANYSKKQKIAYILLIELLAYQFASPVQWIATQDRLFKDIGVENIIEIGPVPILAGMAERTLKLKYVTHDAVLMKQRNILSYQRDLQEIYDQHIHSPKPKELEQPKEQKERITSPPQQHLPLPPPSNAIKQPIATKLHDSFPFKAIDSLKVIIGYKLKNKDVSVNKSIKDLSAGKSTLQNELFGELIKEFGDGKIPDKGEEMEMSELAQMIDSKLSPDQVLPGKYIQSLLSKFASSKFPAGIGMGAVENYLKNKYGIMAGQASSAILAYGLLQEPEGRVVDESSLHSWLDQIVTSFGTLKNINFSSIQADPNSGSGSSTLISSEELEKFEGKHNALLKKQLDIIASYLGDTGTDLARHLDASKTENKALLSELELWIKEHGSDYAAGIKPLFDPLKSRNFNSSWNWAKQDAIELLYDILDGKVESIDRNVTSRCINLFNRARPDLIDFMKFNLGQNVGRSKFLQVHGSIFLENISQALNNPPFYKDVIEPMRPHTEIKDDGQAVYREVLREGVNKFESYVVEMERGGKRQVAASKIRWASKSSGHKPWLYLCKRSSQNPRQWVYNKPLTMKYLEALKSVAVNGMTFEGKVALVTGCGKGSIGLEIVKALLSGGARVIVTTSSYSKPIVDAFRNVYQQVGSKSSSLVVVPFNAASHQDVKGLIEFIYEKLKTELDYVIPFAAVPEVGRDIARIDERSEIAHRAMLTNILRMIGLIADKKLQRSMYTRPATVILPLSPNHGVFGGDGLYGESKAALEPLLNRWHSESWGEYVGIIGAVIGWTRGTGLMSDNNLIAHSLESFGVRTFSTSEMAFNITGLLNRSLITRSQQNGPVWAELCGGLERVNAESLVRRLKSTLLKQVQIAKIKYNEREDVPLLKKIDEVLPNPKALINFGFKFTKQQLVQDESLRELINLEKVVVVTGYGEVGPWGNTRTRWEMESKYQGSDLKGFLSMEGCIELAWMMGLIEMKNHQGVLGWIDVKTKDHVPDHKIKEKYEEYIVEHCGIRRIEPELFEGYDPNNKQFCQEFILGQDLGPFETSLEEATSFKKCHGDKLDLRNLESGRCSVRLLKGCKLFIPKSIFFDRLVAGQIPTGWNAERFGIPKEITGQVDPTTLFVLVAATEALLSSGITDPYEFYQHLHVSQVGNTIGGGEGGMASNKKIFVSRYFDLPASNDVLQESFINTIPAWLNMLLLSSSGPIRTPVGACATAVVSIDSAVDLLLQGKARVVLAGGYDDFGEEGSYEFAQMGATSSSVDEAAQGREPSEMCRPTSDTRGGFMESHGSGVQILMTAKTALDMGVPIYAVLASSNTATDKASRSVPAPGQGILTTARKVIPTAPEDLTRVKNLLSKEYRAEKIRDLAHADELTRKLVGDYWGHEFGRDNPYIAPLEAALSTFGLGIDDIGVASFHGTGTKANDQNESHVLHQQLKYLGRSKGNAISCIFQKYLTGHPKGAAAAWMISGAIQVLNSGIVPGNGNADNIDPLLGQFSDYLFFPSRPFNTGASGGIKAALVKSFGFGQVGGEVLLIRPDILFSILPDDVFSSYLDKVKGREQAVKRYWQDAMMASAPLEGKGLVRIKSSPPYEESSPVYLNPLARINKSTGKFETTAQKSPPSKSDEKAALQLLAQRQISEHRTSGSNGLIGVDIQKIEEFPLGNDIFIENNFTSLEREQLDGKPDKLSSYAGRWAAKEAVYKILSGQREQELTNQKG